IYYIGSISSKGLDLGSNATARMSTATGDGSGGVMFYFSSSSGSVAVTSNSGKAAGCTSISTTSSGFTAAPNGCLVSYKIDGTATSFAGIISVASVPLKCPGGSGNPSQ